MREVSSLHVRRFNLVNDFLKKQPDFVMYITRPLIKCSYAESILIHVHLLVPDKGFYTSKAIRYWKIYNSFFIKPLTILLYTIHVDKLSLFYYLLLINKLGYNTRNGNNRYASINTCFVIPTWKKVHKGTDFMKLYGNRNEWSCGCELHT